MKTNSFNKQDVRSNAEVLLDCFGRGKSNAITNDILRIKIKAATGEDINAAALRRLIHEIRTARPVYRLGVLIGDEAGYYWAASREEAQAWLLSLRSRISAQWEVLRACSANFVSLWQQGTVGQITAESVNMLGFELIAERTHQHPLGFILKQSYGDTSHIWGLVEKVDYKTAVMKFSNIWELLDWWDNKDIPF